MAIVTGDLYKGFTFGDISSKAYGVYITQEAAYDAPERDTEVVEIAGRNGAYILDKGRYKNITVSYKCGIALGDEQSFENAIRVFRNALASEAGKYVRLEDEYNPNEYRQAAFLGGIDVDMADRRAGEFTVSFDAKPQRFLKSGETAVTIGGDVTNTKTESGSIVSIEGTGADKVTSLVAQIEPVQAGSGDPSPTNVRPITGWTAVNVIVSPTTIASDGTTTTTALGRTVYGGTVDVVTGVLTVTWVAARIGALTWGYNSNGNYFYTSSVSKAAGSFNILSDIYATATVDDVTRMGDYHIKGSAANNNLFVTDSRYTTVADFKSANDQRYIYVEAATTQTYQLPAQQVELLTGQNHVRADTGDITITWGDDPNKLVNPTLYDSHPLLHVWGYGDIGIGGDTLSINNDEYGRTLLANRLSKSATSVSSYLDESAVLMLNSGDDVFVSAGSSVVFPLTFLGSASINIISATIANSSPYDFPMESSVSNFGNYVTVSVSLPQLDFIFNQTLQHLRSNIRVTINYTEAGVSKTSTAECQIHAQYSLTPLGRYRVALFYYDVAVDKFRNQNTAVMTIQPIYGVSTQRPFSDDADFYFDLDIGEAYKIEDGQIISVNNAVTIPAQLPTLKSGANTIAYDDTITQFKVVPRWWEV